MIKEIIKKVKLVLFRWRLKRNNFYEDITIVKKKVITRRGEEKETKYVRKIAKKVIAEWMFSLQEEGINIRKFKYLFSELDEIVFPIKIYDVDFYKYGRLIDINFIDNEGKSYYMSKRKLFYTEDASYIIGRRNNKLEPLVDRSFYYKISKDKRIGLMETSATQLNTDGYSYGEMSLRFYYNYAYSTTTAELSSIKMMKEIKIEYLGIDKELEKNLMRFLFENSNKESYYYDSFAILKWLISQISNKENLLSIETKIESKSQVLLGSEVKLKNGIVKKYTYTKIISEEEIQIIQNMFTKELYQFLEENN